MTDEEILDSDLDPVAFDLVGVNPHRATTDPAYNSFLTLMAEGTLYEVLLKPDQVASPLIETYGLCRLGNGRSRAVILYHAKHTDFGFVECHDGEHWNAVNWLRSHGVPLLLSRRLQDPLAPLTRPILKGAHVEPNE